MKAIKRKQKGVELTGSKPEANQTIEPLFNKQTLLCVNITKVSKVV